MYYLTKFCRICIKTGVQLTDIDTIDVDSVRLSEKLEIFMRMVVNNNNNNRENLSRQICVQCVRKLRISYDFQKLCQQSTRILQGYLNELISNKINPEHFVNSELRVTLTPLHLRHNDCNNNETKTNRYRKKRITKEQRCSLLQKLLSTKRNSGVQKKKRFKSQINNKNVGLKNILEFTKNYNFGYNIDKYHQEIIDSPLGKLVNFTKNFFINNFTDFQNTILYLIENSANNITDNDTDDDDNEELMFNTIPQEDNDLLRFEEVIVEPDIKIKNEFDYDDSYNNNINYYVETFYDDVESKKDNKHTLECGVSKEPINLKVQPPQQEQQQQQQQQTTSVQLLDKLVDNFGNHKKFSHFNIRCRTRDNPYINPQLKQQFQLRSFQCKLCNRLFKGPGYLKAHISKVHTYIEDEFN